MKRAGFKRKVWLDGEAAVTLEVQKQGGSNTHSKNPSGTGSIYWVRNENPDTKIVRVIAYRP